MYILQYIQHHSNGTHTYSEDIMHTDRVPYFLTGLSPCTEYTLRIAAINDVGTSEFSSPVETITG